MLPVILKSTSAGPFGWSIVRGLAALLIVGLLTCGFSQPDAVAQAKKPRNNAADAFSKLLPQKKKKPRGYTKAETHIVALATTDVVNRSLAKSETHAAFHGVLVREIARQAVLVSAREELHASTHDIGLFDELGSTDINPVYFPLQIGITVTPEGAVEIELSREVAGKPPVKRKFVTAPLPADRLYEQFVVEAERLSRTDMASFLRDTGHTGKPPASTDDGAVPGHIAESVALLEEMSQLAAIRELHKLIAQKGESVPRLEALVRAYANIGSFTEHHWRLYSKVFKARALLYAQRLVTRAEGSASALAHRAYAWTLVGRPASALEDLNLLAEGVKTKTLKGTVPSWTKVLRAYCDYQPKELEIVDDEDQPLATYLHLGLLIPSADELQTVKLAYELLGHAPSCLRALEYVGNTQGLSIGRNLTEQVMFAIWPRVYQALLRVPDLPEECNTIAKAQAEGGELKEDEQAQRVKVIRLLKASEDARSELRLTVFGNILHEYTLLHARRLLLMAGAVLAIPTEGIVETFTPLVEGHPYQQFVTSDVSNRHIAWREREALQEAISSTDLGVQCEPLISQISMRSGDLQRFRDQALRHSDEILFDLITESDSSPGNERMKTIAARALHITPTMPRTVKWSLYHQWDKIKSQAAEIEQRFADDASVQSALARRYIANTEWDAAERTARRYLELAGEVSAGQLLASIYKRQNKTELWRQTLVDSLELTDTGLGHAEVRVELADYHLDRKEFDLALPYAEDAAQTYAGWALSCCARCREAVGDYAGAEEMIRAIAERYESRFIWYPWCVRTGRGDIDAAREMAEEGLTHRFDPPPINEQSNTVLCHLLLGHNDSMRIFCEGNFKNKPDSYYAMLAAQLADQAGDAKSRDQWLQKASGRYLLVPGFANLANMMAFHLRQGADAKWNEVAFDRAIFDAPAGVVTGMYYFAGRFLLAHNNRELAIRYLGLAASSPQTGYHPTFLACQTLQSENLPLPSRRDHEKSDAIAAMLPEIRQLHAHRMANEEQQVLEVSAAALIKFPDSTPLLTYHAVAAERLGKFDIARQDLQAILKLDPDADMAHHRLARLLASCHDVSIRDPRLALKHALKAHDLWVFPFFAIEDVLASAYAANGEFDKAIAHQKIAIELWLGDGQDFARSRLELYKNKQPHIQKAPLPTPAVPPR